MELEQLQRQAEAAQRLALALGQDLELLKQIETGEVHPAMAAFGLWRDEPDLDGLVDEIYQNRQQQDSRPRIAL